MIVIGLTGPAGSGKSTTASYLARAYGARLFAFAEPLKHIVQRAFDLHTDQLWGPQWLKDKVDPRYNVTPRWLMQRIGTDGMQSVMGKDFWAKYTMRKIEESGATLAVVEDARFLSEVSYMREWCEPHTHGHTGIPCHVWKLDMPWLESSTDHASESEWRLIQEDHVVTTERKSVDDLYLAVDRACAYWGIKPALHSIEAP